MLAAAGRALGDTDAVDAAAQVRAVREALDTLQRIGKAEPGDKTMLDAFIPFAATLESEVQAGQPIGEAWRKAAGAAEAAAQATAPMRPRIGRARPLADRSVGHPDAGAVSFGYIVRTIADQLAG
jgi:dihydroxyacetone kinase